MIAVAELKYLTHLRLEKWRKVVRNTVRNGATLYMVFNLFHTVSIRMEHKLNQLITQLLQYRKISFNKF